MIERIEAVLSRWVRSGKIFHICTWAVGACSWVVLILGQWVAALFFLAAAVGMACLDHPVFHRT